MSFLDRIRQNKQARALNKELGQGLWRRAHDRYIRALDRYHQMLAGVDDVETYNELALLGNDLADQLATIQNICVKYQQLFPSDDLTVPGEGRRVHSHLSSASNSLATCAEAVAMLRAGQVRIEQVRFRSEKVFEEIRSAQEHAGDYLP